jgi:hypothetical protein
MRDSTYFAKAGGEKLPESGSFADLNETALAASAQKNPPATF